MFSTSKVIRHYYSPRGARRGLRLAAITAAIWICWAIGYTQGSSRLNADKASEQSATKTHTPNNTHCCIQRLDI